MEIFAIDKKDSVFFIGTCKSKCRYLTLDSFEELILQYDTETKTDFFTGYSQVMKEENRKEYIKYFILYTQGGIFLDSPEENPEGILSLYTYCKNRDIQLLQCSNATIAMHPYLVELSDILQEGVKKYLSITNKYHEEHCSKILITPLTYERYASLISKETDISNKLNISINSISSLTEKVKEVETIGKITLSLGVLSLGLTLLRSLGLISK